MGSSTGRNDPCPCGSGRKFKRCHGGAVQAAGFPRGAHRDRIARQLLSALYGEARDVGREALEAFMRLIGHYGKARLAPYMESEMSQSAINTYALFDLTDDEGRTFAERYRIRRGALLAENERAYIDTLVGSFVDFYEVRRVDLHEGLDLRNLRSSDNRFVHERLATESIVRYDIVATRVIEVEPERFELYPPVLVFPQSIGRSALAFVKDIAKRERAATKGLTDVRDTLKAELPTIHAMWIESQMRRSPKHFRTSEGDALEPATLTFRLRNRARAVAALDASPLFDRQDEDDMRYAYVGAEGSGPTGEGRLLLGNLEVHEDELVAQVMAASRAERLKAELIALDATAFELVSEDRQDIEEFMRSARSSTPSAPRAGGAPQEGDVIDPMQIPEIAQRMALLQDRWDREWLDQSIPALSGRTPREAARSRTLRPRVIALLKEREAMEERAHRSGKPLRDISWMWRDLDLRP